jgi:mono/diheme cytochrome c family protein
MRRAILLPLFALIFMGARHHVVEQPRSLDIRRSIIVTDLSVVNGNPAFALEHVFQTLINGADAAMTPTQLFQQMFDTQNPKPGLAVANAPHCDDFLVNGEPSFNGFPRRCPTPEGALAMLDPFERHGTVDIEHFIPLAIVNRFDRAPQDGSNCGEYRLIYAYRTGDPNQMLHIIFEGVLPNPAPQLGLAACRPIADFWAGLSSVDSNVDRGNLLEKFFFFGIDGFPPVIAPDHFGAKGGGDIRTVELSPSMRDFPRFYNFRLVTDHSTGSTRLIMQPDILENTVFGPLFDGGNDSDLAKAFRTDFIQQIASLTQPGVNFTDHVPQKYLTGESDNIDTPLAFRADTNFDHGVNTAAGQQFRDAIAAELARLGNPVTVPELLNRVNTQNCNGCHNGDVTIGGGLRFPNGTGAHVIENVVNDDNVPRWQISPAVRDVFAPARAQALVNYLQTGKLPPHSN